MTLKGKRLFLADGQENWTPGPESAEDRPIIGPEELYEALRDPKIPSYEEVSAKWQALAEKIFSNLASL